MRHGVVKRGDAGRIRAQRQRESRRHRLDRRQHLARDRREDRRRHRIKRHRDHHAALCLIKGRERADRAWHLGIVAVLLIGRVDDRGRGQDPHFEIGDARSGKAKLRGGGARYVELALAPIGPGIVDADDSGAAVLGIADQDNCAIWINRARGAVGLVRAKRFAGRRQAARVVAVAAAIIIVRSLKRLILADDGDHFGNAQDPVADAIEAICLAGGFGFGGRDGDCRQHRSEDCSAHRSPCVTARQRAPTVTRDHSGFPLLWRGPTRLFLRMLRPVAEQNINNALTLNAAPTDNNRTNCPYNDGPVTSDFRILRGSSGAYSAKRPELRALESQGDLELFEGFVEPGGIPTAQHEVGCGTPLPE